jgi:ribonuclease HII
MPLSIQFAVDGDSLFPSAAASMLAKGIRESLMRRLNRFWQQQVGDRLLPTAGYAVDARRFAADIAAARAKLGILEEQWWRMR